MPAHRNDDLVYSTQSGRVCTTCGRPTAKCVCRDSPRAARGDGIVRIRREVKGRRGKTVTTIAGVPLPQDALRDLAAELKRRVGTGGSTKGSVIEIQGDHCDILAEELRERGYTVERVGG